MSDPPGDHDALTEQYHDASNLNARIALHERYSTNERGLRPWLFDQFDLSDGATVLGLGCGPGDTWAENATRVPGGWSVLVTDRSPGMVAEARENLHGSSIDPEFGVVDAQDVPFVDETFDAITANHMLYHVPDRDRAFTEINRVLKPGGCLYASTNGEKNMEALHDAVEPIAGPYPRATEFSLENGGAQLREFFESVERRRFDDALVVTKTEPLVAYILSRDGFDASMASALRDAFEERFKGGEFRIEKDVGLFVARKKP